MIFSFATTQTKATDTMRGTRGGFLLVELIVALFIFSIVMVVAIGSIVTALDANRKAQSLESVMNNLNLAMDEMTKSLAVGKDYSCGADTPGDGVGDDCPPSGGSLATKISFTSQEDQTVTYEFVPPSGANGGYITRRVGGVSAPALRLTATEINVDAAIDGTSKSGFYVSGTNRFSGGDAAQPYVSLFISGTVKAGPRNSTTFSVQTSVSQRIPDINS